MYTRFELGTFRLIENHASSTPLSALSPIINSATVSYHRRIFLTVLGQAIDDRGRIAVDSG